jgi:hypothetical protein
VRGTGIDEVSPPELANVPQSLEDFGVDETETQLVDTNVVPDGVAQYFEVHGPSFYGFILWGRRS